MFSSKSYPLFFLLGLTAIFVTATTAAQNSADDSDSRTRDLLVEKRDTLASFANYSELQFRHGELKIQAVLDAKLKVLDAELALADSAAERVKILEERRDNRRSKESQLETLYNNGDATMDEKVKATVERIDAVIALLREAARK